LTLALSQADIVKLANIELSQPSSGFHTVSQIRAVARFARMPLATAVGQIPFIPAVCADETGIVTVVIEASGRKKA
jgi:hypothetical protein